MIYIKFAGANTISYCMEVVMEKRLNSRLYFKESSLSNVYELFHKFAENFLFFRWIFFKNRPRTTFLLVRSILVSSLVFGAYYSIFSSIDFFIMGIDVNPFLLFTASFIVGYWHMSDKFGKKSLYLANLYNEVVRYKSKGDNKTANILALNFSTQLLTMDLWGHRLYSWLLSESLEQAASWHCEKSGSSYEEFLDLANSGKLSVSHARNILISYMQKLNSTNENNHLKAM